MKSIKFNSIYFMVIVCSCVLSMVALLFLQLDQSGGGMPVMATLVIGIHIVMACISLIWAVINSIVVLVKSLKIENKFHMGINLLQVVLFIVVVLPILFG